MMDYLRNHPILSLLVGGGIVLIAIIAVTVQALQSNDPKADQDPQQATSFYSPLAQTSDSLLVNYGGSADPNQDAVHGRFKVLGLDAMPLPQSVKDSLSSSLTTSLEKVITPTYSLAYIHIDRSSINCHTQFDCRFSLYIDSPESYHSYHSYLKPDGSQAYSLTAQPFPGAGQ